MDRYLRIAAFIANIFFALLMSYFISRTYNMQDQLIGYATLLVPFLNIYVLRFGPDREELKLREQVRKARLRAELARLSKING